MHLPGSIRRAIALVISLVVLISLLPVTRAAASHNTPTPSEWARDDVAEANSLGLVPNSISYAYQRNISRAEFCALAVLLYEKVNGVISLRSPAFADSSDTDVLKMAALGVVNGVGNNMFYPKAALTREQAAVILVRLVNSLNRPLEASSPTFSDRAEISSWAVADVGKVQASGIMNGMDGNQFDPKGNYTREQSIVAILRIWNIVKPDETVTFTFPYIFTAADLYGKTVTEESLGEKELFFVHYWATWCAPCLNEMPELAKIVEQYGDRVGFIALLDDYGSARDAAIRIVEESGVSFTVVDARHSDFQPILKKLQTGYIPTTILIDSDGEIVGKQIIGAYGSAYSDFIDEALEKPSQ